MFRCSETETVLPCQDIPISRPRRETGSPVSRPTRCRWCDRPGVGRAASTISARSGATRRETGADRPHVADGAYMLRRHARRRSRRYAKPRPDRHGSPTEGRDARAGRSGGSAGSSPACAPFARRRSTAVFTAPAEDLEWLWRLRCRHRHARRRKRRRPGRPANDRRVIISPAIPVADACETAGHWKRICDPRTIPPGAVPHERKTRITLMSRLWGKTAAETIAVMTAAFRRLDPSECAVWSPSTTIPPRPPHAAARHALGDDVFRRRRTGQPGEGWRRETPTGASGDGCPEALISVISEADIQEIAMTIDLTPRECVAYRFTVQVFLSELGRDVEIRFVLYRSDASRCSSPFPAESEPRSSSRPSACGLPTGSTVAFDWLDRKRLHRVGRPIPDRPASSPRPSTPS